MRTVFHISFLILGVHQAACFATLTCFHQSINEKGKVWFMEEGKHCEAFVNTLFFICLFVLSVKYVE